LTTLIIIILTISFILSNTTVFAAGAPPPAKKLPILTGNQVTDLLAVVKSQYIDANNRYAADGNGSIYAVEMGGTATAPWCAYFVAWCADKANIDSTIIRRQGGADCDKIIGADKYYSNYPTRVVNFTPKPGDLVFFGTNQGAEGDHHANHVAIVTNYNSANDTIDFIEGNWAGKVNICEGVKLDNTNPKNVHPPIQGFGRPNYKSGSIPTQNPPTAPAGLTATRVDDTTAKISWFAVSSATSYEVQYYSQSGSAWRTDTDYKPNTTTSYNSKGIVNNSTKYRVRAGNSGGWSEWSEITYTKTTTPTLPAAPTGLTATKSSDTTVKISWNAASGATSYEVQWKWLFA